MPQDIAPSMGDLASSNAKARLDQGEVMTFTAYSKADGSPVVVDPRTFDESWMTKDKAEADAIVAAAAEQAAAAAAEKAAAEKKVFDDAVAAEVARQLAALKSEPSA